MIRVAGLMEMAHTGNESKREKVPPTNGTIGDSVQPLLELELQVQLLLFH